MEKYEKVLELMKRKGGKLQVEDPELGAVLGTAKKSGKPLTYRLHVYMSYIRRFARLEVVANRVGRIATSYELIRVGTDENNVALWQHSKYSDKAKVTPSRLPVPSYDLKRDDTTP